MVQHVDGEPPDAQDAATQAGRIGPLSSREASLLLSDFPPVAHAFAYGSAVFAPEQYTKAEASGAMTDLVFAVRDPLAWHRANLSIHPRHYSLVGRLGPGAVAALQEHSGARAYYNAMVSWRGRLIKYGVVSVDALIDDLLHWTHLYLAGRMHKPTQVLISAPEVEAAARVNLRSAAAAALLLQPTCSFSEEELLSSICGLSYAGDPRQALVEASKPREIAATHARALRAMYAEPLRELVGLEWGTDETAASKADRTTDRTRWGPDQTGLTGEGRAGRSGPPCPEDSCGQSPPLLQPSCPDSRFCLSPSLTVRETLLLALPSRAKAELGTELRPGLFRGRGLFRDQGLFTGHGLFGGHRPFRGHGLSRVIDAGPNWETSGGLSAELGNRTRSMAKAPLGRLGRGMPREDDGLSGGAGDARPTQASSPPHAPAGAPAAETDTAETDEALLEQVRGLYARSANGGLAARELGFALQSAVGRIVRRSSTSQTLKGALTGGAITTVRYVAAKIGKQMRR
jgi:translocator assembly and maintenance protein 41